MTCDDGPERWSHPRSHDACRLAYPEAWKAIEAVRIADSGRSSTWLAIVGAGKIASAIVAGEAGAMQAGQTISAYLVSMVGGMGLASLI